VDGLISGRSGQTNELGQAGDKRLRHFDLVEREPDFFATTHAGETLELGVPFRQSLKE